MQYRRSGRRQGVRRLRQRRIVQENRIQNGHFEVEEIIERKMHRSNDELAENSAPRLR